MCPASPLGPMKPELQATLTRMGVTVTQAIPVVERLLARTESRGARRRLVRTLAMLDQRAAEEAAARAAG
jgi:hypothetical protein